jgi:hypothetical protein
MREDEPAKNGSGKYKRLESLRSDVDIAGMDADYSLNKNRPKSSQPKPPFQPSAVDAVVSPVGR